MITLNEKYKSIFPINVWKQFVKLLMKLLERLREKRTVHCKHNEKDPHDVVKVFNGLFAKEKCKIFKKY